MTSPSHPGELPPTAWKDILVRTWKKFQRDELGDKAAALTYYGVLALFPGLIVLVALLGLLGQYPQTVNAVFKILTQAGASKDTINAIRSPLEGVVKSKGGAGALLGVGLLGAVWSASSYMGAFMRAANAVYGVREGRPFWRLRPLQVGITLIMLAVALLLLTAMVVTGPFARAIGDAIGVGSSAVAVWNVAKWPVIAVLALGMIAVLYYAAPNVRQPKLRWITPGGVLALALWALASVGFAFYVSNFGSYNKTYGTLGGIVALLVWLWITNLALLLGLEFDAELEREREIASGVPEEQTLQLEPRQAPKDAEAA
ncbi:MAG: ribonuclease [Solirubrobacterales bacterium]|jgi:membrane protein|nr:ribonuclease [Solirubrobacterales bacterium]